MAAPKCRECRRHTQNLWNIHKCSAKMFFQIEDKEYAKSSPKWCPLRKGGNDDTERASETP